MICVLSFAVLGWIGTKIYRIAPLIPKKEVSNDDSFLLAEGQVQRGPKAWLSASGQQLVSVGSRSSYVAPDRLADRLHRDALALQAARAQREFGRHFEQLGAGQKADLNDRLRTERRCCKSFGITHSKRSI